MLESLAKPLEQLAPGIEVPPLSLRGREAFEVEVQPPGSKSLTNRAMLLAGLADGTSVIRGALHGADDSQQMCQALERLGAKIEHGADGTISVRGVGGRWKVPPEGVTLNINNAGTAARFLAGAALLGTGPITIDGNARMRERPIGALAEALGAMGATVEHLGRPGCVPIRITPPQGPIRPAGVLDIPTTQSSQFVSALLLASPWFAGPLTVRLIGPIASGSYVAMTLGLLGRLGATVQYSENMRVIRVSGGRGNGGTRGEPGLRGFQYDVEPDASGATYFWGAAAVTPGAMCRVLGIGEDSLQGDAMFPGLLERMGARVARRTPVPNHQRTSGARPGSHDAFALAGGVWGVPGPDSDGVERYIECRGPAQLRPILADMTDMPDATMTLAVVASFAGGNSILRGIRTLRHKESDRVAALTNELAKVGVRVISPVAGDEDVMTITPPSGGIATGSSVAPVEFQTYDDHRMAMSLALIGLRRPGVTIQHPACVAKTYPEFWKHLAGLYEG